MYNTLRFERRDYGLESCRGFHFSGCFAKGSELAFQARTSGFDPRHPVHLSVGLSSLIAHAPVLQTGVMSVRVTPGAPHSIADFGLRNSDCACGVTQNMRVF